MQEDINQAVFMIANEIFYALIDKVPDTVFECSDEIDAFKNPIYSWVDSNGEKQIRACLQMEKSTAEDLARSMYTLGETDQVTAEDVKDAFGEIANVIGGNLKSVVEDSGNLTIPRVSTEAPWISDSPLARLNLNWKGKFLIVSISDLASKAEEQGERV